MAATDLLPPGSTEFERSFSRATDSFDRLADAVSFMRGIKFNPPPSFVPFLVYEYGLGELSPYVPNIGDLIELGIDWERVRGTDAALAIGFDWLGYVPTLDEFPAWRRRWNHFQVRLDRVRDDTDDLRRIAGVGQLSVPVRSVFWRSYHAHDVRAVELGRSAWGENFFAAYSGVRVADIPVKWSFGRRYEIDHAMTQSELEALGVWIEPSGSGQLTWGPFPWPPEPWGASEDLTRSREMLLNTYPRGPAWAVFKDAGGSVIGYRRAKAYHPVRSASSGEYRLGASTYTPEEPGTATILYVEALTDFGEGYGATAESVGFILGAEPTDPGSPGLLWAGPGEITPEAPIIAERPLTIAFGRTIRERLCAVLRF